MGRAPCLQRAWRAAQALRFSEGAREHLDLNMLAPGRAPCLQ